MGDFYKMTETKLDRSVDRAIREENEHALRGVIQDEINRLQRRAGQFVSAGDAEGSATCQRYADRLDGLCRRGKIEQAFALAIGRSDDWGEQS